MLKLCLIHCLYRHSWLRQNYGSSKYDFIDSEASSGVRLLEGQDHHTVLRPEFWALALNRGCLEGVHERWRCQQINYQMLHKLSIDRKGVKFMASALFVINRYISSMEAEAMNSAFLSVDSSIRILTAS